MDAFDQTGDVLSFDYATDGDLGYVSSVAYDLTGGERVSLYFEQLPDGSQAEMYFAVGNNNSHDVYWTLTSNTFTCSYDNGFQADLWQGAAPTLPAWVSLHEHNGKIQCEILDTASSTWLVRASIGGNMDPTWADVSFGVYSTVSASIPPSVVKLDSYNMPPVP
jgi:hypothetical protein